MIPSDRDLATLTDRVLEHVGGRAEAIVTVARRRHGLTRFANSVIHQHVGEDTTSVALTVARDQRTARATTTRIGDAALDRLVEVTLELVPHQPQDTTWPGVAGASPVADGNGADASTVAATPDDRAATVAAFVAAGDGLNAAGYCDTDVFDVAVATSAGQRCAARSSRATLDGIHRTASSAGNGHRTSRTFGDLDGHAVGAGAAERARVARNGRDTDPGTYEVVLAPDAVASLVTFLGLYGFNAKSHLEGSSGIHLDTGQFDPSLTLTDDVHDHRSVALPFDDEGTPTATVPLIEGGRTTGLVHDRRTAHRAGTTSTGHGHAASATWGPVPRSLVVAPGPERPESLVGAVERGLFVSTFHYCRVLDPKTLVVTGLTRNGTFLIEDGTITTPITDLRFTQSFLEALAPGHVLGIGDDDRFADSESGVGNAIVPSLRLASWRFTGGVGG